MTTLFIADLHLSEKQPDIPKEFLCFLKNTAVNADALYILGDLFEVWIGDDDRTDFNQIIIDALKQLTNTGVPVYIVHGNRDFLIGKKFIKATGCELLKDPSVVKIYGVPVILTHGDILCTHDLKYLAFRKKTRNWFAQKFFLCKPLKKRRAIADKMRAASKTYNLLIPDRMQNVVQKEVELLMKQHGVTTLIHGHIHNAAIRHFKLGPTYATRIVLGDWGGNSEKILTCQLNKNKDSLEFEFCDI